MFLPACREGDWTQVRKNFQKLSSIKLGDRAAPTFAELTLTGLTASRLISTDSSKKLTSVSDLTSWIAGTSNQIAVANDADGTITLSTPQDIHTGATPEFTGATLTDLLTINQSGDGTGTNYEGIKIHGFDDHSGEYAFLHVTSGGYSKLFASAGLLISATDEVLIDGGNGNVYVAPSFYVRTTEHVELFGVTAAANIRCWPESTAGQTKEFEIYGYKSGDSLRKLEIGVGVDANDTASFDGVSNYLFDGTVKATILNATDEDNALQIDGTTVFRTGTSTNYNIFSGSGAFNNDDGILNVGMGFQVGYNNDTTGGNGDPKGEQNIYIGYQSGYGNTTNTKNTGWNNVGLGRLALFHNTSGNRLMAIGDLVLYSNTTGRGGVGVGAQCLYSNVDGDSSVGIGTSALFSNVSGDNDVGIGGLAFFNLIGTLNTGIGGNVGYSSTSADRNYFGGYAAGYFNQTGDDNVIIGAYAAFGVSGNSFSDNVFIGADSGRLITIGSRDVFLGYKAGYNQTIGSDLLIIDNQDRGSAAAEITNCLIYGIFHATPASQSLRINGEILGSDGAKIGDGGTTDYTEIEADGTIKFNGAATVWEDLQFTISDAKVPAANFPTWETFTTNTKEYSFAVDDYIDTKANETSHAWKLGTSGHVHLHITTKAANSTGSNRYAKFTIYLSYCDTGETWQETSLTAELTIPNGTSALQMFYLDMGDLTLTNYVLESEIKMRVSRITATGGTEYAGNIFLTQAGIHFEHDTIGSRQETTK